MNLVESKASQEFIKERLKYASRYRQIQEAKRRKVSQDRINFLQALIQPFRIKPAH